MAEPANDNWVLTDADIISVSDEVADILAWVRPVAAAMRAVAIPEEVVQKAMGRLLDELDAYLDDPQTVRQN